MIVEPGHGEGRRKDEVMTDGRALIRQHVRDGQCGCGARRGGARAVIFTKRPS